MSEKGIFMIKFRTMLPTLALGLGLVSSCNSASDAKQQAVSASIPQKVFSEDPKLKSIVCDTFSRQMSDEKKIIEYNKLLNEYGMQNGNYIIVNKNYCLAKVLSPDGDVLFISEVALGKDIGDKRSGGYGVKGVKSLAYTTPGEFVVYGEGTEIEKEKKLYGDRCLAIAGDHTLKEYADKETLALHRVPSSRMGDLRKEVFHNKTSKDNRVSYGCVNFLVPDYDNMRALIDGIGTTVYILPEEQGNSLKLKNIGDGKYKFVQTKYETEKMENN